MRKYQLDRFDDAGASGAALLRNKIGDYCRFGGEGSPWYFMGPGFTQLDENPGAQSESETYIHEVTSSASINSYQTVFPFTSRMIPEQKALYNLWKIGRDHKTGAEAQIEFCKVDLFNPVGEPSETKAEFTARKFVVSVEVSSTSGNGGEKLQVSGNLNAVGDPVQGKFDTVAKEFTAGTFEGKYDSVTPAG